MARPNYRDICHRVMYANQSWLEIINIRVNIQFALSCGEGRWRQRSTKGFTEHSRHVSAICNSICDSANYVVRSLVMYVMNVMIFVPCTRYYTNMQCTCVPNEHDHHGMWSIEFHRYSDTAIRNPTLNLEFEFVDLRK